MTDLASVEACEQRLVNLWPAVDTMLLGRWALRFANGYSGRANSASPLWRGADLDEAEIAHVVGLYRNGELQPAIRLTPLAAPALGERLAAAGWGVRTRSNGMIAAPRREWTAHAAVAFTAAPTPDWLDGVSALQEPGKRDPAHLAAIVGRIRVPAGFATLLDEGRPVGFGVAAIDRGWAEIGSIVVAPACRGRGLGRRLVSSLLGWAAARKAERVFLQVESGNAAAADLYRTLGFADLYRYTELRLPA